MFIYIDIKVNCIINLSSKHVKINFLLVESILPHKKVNPNIH